MDAFERTFIEDVLAAIGTALYILRAVPQLIQIRKTGDVEEGSEFTLDLLLVSGVWWIAYSIEIENVPTLVSTVLGMIAPAYCLWVLFKKDDLPKLALVLPVIAFLLLPVALVNPREVAVGATLAGAIVTVPQTVKVLRSGNLAGLGLSTWVLAGANALIWLIYALMIKHPMVGAAAIATLPCCVAVGVGVLRARSRKEVTV